MTDTPETLKAALADLTARVAAFEKARVEEEEPPVCSEALLAFLERGCESLGGSDYQKAAREIRYLRGELARLREGLKVQPGDYRQSTIDNQASEGDPACREIQRHRALLKDGGGK